jgi:hypothetical protein
MAKFALALLISSLPAALSSQVPTMEQAESDSNYKRAGSRQLSGQCAPMEPLAEMLRKNDDVAKIVVTSCDHVMFTPPSEGVNPADNNGFMAFVQAKKKTGTYFRGQWSDGDFNIGAISFDQVTWLPTSKGRVRIYRKDNSNSMMFVVFAVFDQGGRKGTAFRFEG